MKCAVKCVSRFLVATPLLFSIAACSEQADLSRDINSPRIPSDLIVLDVYKSRTCGCCKKWIDHAEGMGIEADVHHPSDLNKIKIDQKIEPRYQSCHTAISTDGYVFEGHIPAEVIQKFLASPPKDAIGLAVPGMPVGSPGMEVGDRFDPYDVLLLKKDGSSEVYQHISKPLIAK
ncbi:DUF411 domain-containing protein [uncultured Pseudoteredinibacter sp.]|uniref:DUF411 domain-containing protein n=1 Tax=uncultured Pseudoteredinibacter sp. TaxID=1641701 RepID=UPI00261B3BF7|nr:DUF411 domain-containing protein [uncultured Pseudoteredinibacter sp.]